MKGAVVICKRQSGGYTDAHVLSGTLIDIYRCRRTFNRPYAVLYVNEWLGLYTSTVSQYHTMCTVRVPEVITCTNEGTFESRAYNYFNTFVQQCTSGSTCTISASGASAVGQLGEVRVGLIGSLDRDRGLKQIPRITNGASTSSPGVPSRFVG